MQQHQQETDKRIDEVFLRLDEGNAKPKQGVFYNGQIYDAKNNLEKAMEIQKIFCGDDDVKVKKLEERIKNL